MHQAVRTEWTSFQGKAIGAVCLQGVGPPSKFICDSITSDERATDFLQRTRSCNIPPDERDRFGSFALYPITWSQMVEGGGGGRYEPKIRRRRMAPTVCVWGVDLPVQWSGLLVGHALLWSTCRCCCGGVVDLLLLWGAGPLGLQPWVLQYNGASLRLIPVQ